MRVAPIDYPGQQQLVAALQTSLCIQHECIASRTIETHISWVIIAGAYAYKIKKAVDLGFLDFTSLQARHFFCDEELRLNRRLAADLYLETVAIGGTADEPKIGEEPAIEYAVKMHSFNPDEQLDLLLQQGKIQPPQIEALAVLLADFHQHLTPANPEDKFGTPASIQAVVQQNLAQLQTLFAGSAENDAIAELSNTTLNRFKLCQDYFNQRLQHGFVRECHGDLHTGNIALINARLLPFDSLEFNAALRWIDVMDEVAFLVMDLLHLQQPAFAFRFLNSYLEQTGDFAGLKIFSFYLTHRALVRAKVYALRAAAQNGDALTQSLATSRSYLALAATPFPRHPPALIILHGLPGSGKSTYAQLAQEKFQAIRIRSDVVRKRLHGLKPLDNSHSGLGNHLYSAAASEQTYAHLLELASSILEAGHTVIVDAAFLQQHFRVQFQALALKLSVPFAILSLHASANTLESRLIRRRNKGKDASEADVEVLQKLQQTQDLLQSYEMARCVEFESGDTSPGSHHANWAALEKLLLR